MKYTEAGLGRVFVISLDDGERLPAAIEEFAAKKGVQRGLCFLLGASANCGTIVSGPEDGDALPPVPMLQALAGIHEMAGIGTIFPDDEGVPRLHLHAAFGRGGSTRVGCIRPGIDVWKLGEVVIVELTGSEARRRHDDATGFSLLSP